MKTAKGTEQLATADCCLDLARFLDPQFFKALCDPSRLAILGRLASDPSPRSVSEIAALGDIDMSVVSRHLSQLRSAGIVESFRRGKEVLYRIRAGGVVRFLRNLADALERCCPVEMTGGGTAGTRTKGE